MNFRRDFRSLLLLLVANALIPFSSMWLPCRPWLCLACAWLLAVYVWFGISLWRILTRKRARELREQQAKSQRLATRERALQNHADDLRLRDLFDQEPRLLELIGAKVSPPPRHP